MFDDRSYFAGIEPDGMRDVYEIKILICYLLECLSEPFTHNQMNQLFQEEKLVNYFSFCAAVKELKEDGHITAIPLPDHDEKYELNDLGRETARKLKTALPLSVREKVVASAMELLARLKRERLHETGYIKTEDGFMASLRIHDVGSDLMQLSLFAPEEEQAKFIKKQLSEHTTTIYQAIVSLLLLDEEGLMYAAEAIRKAKEEAKENNASEN